MGFCLLVKTQSFAYTGELDAAEITGRGGGARRRRRRRRQVGEDLVIQTPGQLGLNANPLDFSVPGS